MSKPAREMEREREERKRDETGRENLGAGSGSGSSLFDRCDVDMASVEQLRKLWESVVVDKGKMLGHSGEAISVAKDQCHKKCNVDIECELAASSAPDPAMIKWTSGRLICSQALIKSSGSFLGSSFPAKRMTFPS